MRLIPAHAGKTGRRALRSSPQSAHPRSRGENVAHRRTDSSSAGSSPLTRGKHVWSPSRGSARRLIPAHAGKTIPYAVGVAYCRAHPRSRGENSSRVMTSPMVRGSSPLTRGKHFSDAHLTAISRLIPAHAGKTVSVATTTIMKTAHPRSRGENDWPDVSFHM